MWFGGNWRRAHKRGTDEPHRGSESVGCVKVVARSVRSDSVSYSIIVANANVMNFIDLYACTYKYFDVRVNVPSLQYLYKDRNAVRSPTTNC